MNNLFNTGLQTVSLANAAALEPDEVYVSGASSGYEKLTVYQLIGRVSEKISIVNFGPGALYFRFSLDGRRWSEREIFLPAPTVYRVFVVVVLNKIYELRIRSPNAACQFQALEGIFGI